MLALRKKMGFTLLELVIVMVIIGILVTLALPRFTGARRRAYRVEALGILSEVKGLAWAYNLEQGGTDTVPVWPTTWPNMGFSAAPNTANWRFTISTSGSPLNFLATATAETGSPADGSPDVVLTLKPDGTSTLS